MKLIRTWLMLWIGVGVFAAHAVAADVEWEAYVNINEWNQALNHGDVDSLAALYTDDAVVLDLDGRVSTNSEEIREFWRSRLSADQKGDKLVIIEFQGDADRIVTAAKWLAAGAKWEGTLVSIFERQGDGTWKTRFQRWN